MNAIRRAAAVVAATAAVVVCAPVAAVATEGTGVEATTLSQATVDGIDYVAREITIAPGGSTGWHYHDGRVFGVVRQGTLTHNAANCSIDGIYPPGAPVTEQSGPDHVHVGRNLAPVPVVMWIVYVKPAGAPFAVDAPDPGCGFA